MTIGAFDWVAHYARVEPNKLAVIDLATHRKFTYGEFNRRIDRLAAFLKNELCVRTGDRVAINAKNSSSTFESQFACARIGAIFVPTNWRLSVFELEAVLSNAEPSVFICDREFSQADAAVARRWPSIQRVGIDTASRQSDFERGVGEDHGAFKRAKPKLDDVWTLLYTSGTTGLAKGVALTFGMNVFNAINFNPIVRMRQDSHALCSLPTFHTGGLNCSANPCFYAGGTVSVMREFKPDEMLRLLEDRTHALTHIFGVPATYQFLARQPGFDQADLSHLVSAGVGGAPSPLPMLQAYARRGLGLQQGYGMTETGPVVTLLPIDRASEKLGSAGLPVLHLESRVVNQNGLDVRTDEVGELWVRGPAITPGYWNNRGETQRAFTMDGWLRTGDAARVDEEGFYFLVDRWRDMYISGGENVYPAEVENVIAALPGVLEVAVVGVPDQCWGEVGHAAVVGAPGSGVTAADIIKECRAKIAGYKVPGYITFLESLPRSAVGKVLKREIRAMFDRQRGIPVRPAPGALHDKG